MKKIATLALAAAFVTAAYAPASAVDVKLDGEWLYQFQTASEGFNSQNTEWVGSRMRLGTTISVNENLRRYDQNAEFVLKNSKER